MSDKFAVARLNMVQSQLLPIGVNAYSVLAAFHKIAREDFLPTELKARAYSDRNIKLPSGRVLLSPATFGQLVQLADIFPDDCVLDVAAGTGYSSAILSQLAAQVTSVELQADLLPELSANLDGFSNVRVADFAQLAADIEQYDIIFVQGAIEHIPDYMISLLKDGGRLLALKPNGAICSAYMYVKHNDHLDGQAYFECYADRLPMFDLPRKFTL